MNTNHYYTMHFHHTVNHLWIRLPLPCLFFLKHSSRYYIKIPHSKPLFSFAKVQLTLLSRGFYAYFQSPCLAWYPQYLDVHSS